MKRSAITATVISLLLSTAAPALAGSGARSDNSGFVVWVFLGFCALIVVAQIVPALMVMLGFVKGIAEGKENTVKEQSH